MARGVLSACRKSLHEVLEIKDDRILSYVDNYRISLLESAAMRDEDISRLRSDQGSDVY